MPDIRAVVFDFGGVLFDWSAEYLYRELIPDEAERRWFLTHVCSPAWNLKQDGGRPIAEAEAELIALHPDHAEFIRAFYGQWPKTLRGLLDDGVAMLRQLHTAGVPLYGLTNWSAETYHHVEDKLRTSCGTSATWWCRGASAWSSRIRASMRTCWSMWASRRSAASSSTTMPRNAEAASALGLYGITHRSGAETSARLRDLGVGILTRWS